MASPASSEASEIRRRGRQRLIGAVALVLLLVVFVPMVLDSEPRPARPIPEIPARENAPALPPPAPAAAKPATQPQAPTPATAKVEAAPIPAPKTPVATKPAGDAKAATPRMEGFAVQVGAFRDEAKLKQARDKLSAAKVAHYTERLDSSGGPLTRLRAGPFPTREAAEAAQATLKRAALDGQVVPLP
ncbi:MAG TPA: SPOR domain-containing protein [Usitatibacter sp.]|nr:SPOR domain-containing protein [Usitatibacter sp.]